MSADRQPGGPDIDEAIGFLRLWRPRGLLNLVSITTDGKIAGRTWDAGRESSWPMIARWIADENRRGFNIYFTINEIGASIASKPKKSDIVRATAAYADIDPTKGRPYEDERSRLLGEGLTLLGITLGASVIIDSGHGLQGLWWLDAPIENELYGETDPEKAKPKTEFEKLNDKIGLAIGSKGTWNVDRVFRVPGTLNYPNAVKLKNGYPSEPTRARLLHADGTLHDINDLIARLPEPPPEPVLEKPKASVEEKQERPRAAGTQRDWEAEHVDRVQQIIRNGAAEGERSEAFHDAVCTLCRAGWSEGRIEAEMRNHPVGIAEKYLSPADRLAEEIKRSYEKTEPSKYNSHAHGGGGRAHSTASAGAANDAPPDFAADPVNLWGTFQPPELPRGVLPKVIEDYAFAKGDLMGADPAGLAMAALGVCAAALSDKIRLRVKVHDPGWHESARLWIALVGEPSTKKSPIILDAAYPLKRIDAELLRQWKRKQAEHEAAHEGKGKAGLLPCPRKRIEDTTIEAAQQVLQDSPDGVLCIQDELSGWFGGMDKYNGPKGGAKDKAFWLQSYNGGEYAFNRVQRGSGLIENLSITIVGGIQPDPIRRVAADATDDGLIQRLTPVVLRPASVDKDEPTPPMMIDAYRNAVAGLAHMKPPTVSGTGNLSEVAQSTLRLDEGGQAIRNSIAGRHHKMGHIEVINKKLAAHLQKYDGIFARLCVLLHCLNYSNAERPPEVIAKATARRAADFLHRFLLPHAVAFYGNVLGMSDDHDRLKRVAGYILAHNLTVVKYRDVQRGDKTMRNLTRADTARVLEQLEALGWLEQEPPLPRSNASPGWLVNPKVHELYAQRAAAEDDRRKAARAEIADVCRYVS